MGKEGKVAEVVAASLIKPGLVEDLVVDLCYYGWKAMKNGGDVVFGDMVVQAVDEVLNEYDLQDVMNHRRICRRTAEMLGLKNIYGKDEDDDG